MYLLIRGDEDACAGLIAYLASLGGSLGNLAMVPYVWHRHDAAIIVVCKWPLQRFNRLASRIVALLSQYP